MIPPTLPCLLVAVGWCCCRACALRKQGAQHAARLQGGARALDLPWPCKGLWRGSCRHAVLRGSRLCNMCGTVAATPPNAANEHVLHRDTAACVGLGHATCDTRSVHQIHSSCARQASPYIKKSNNSSKTLPSHNNAASHVHAPFQPQNSTLLDPGSAARMSIHSQKHDTRAFRFCISTSGGPASHQLRPTSTPDHQLRTPAALAPRTPPPPLPHPRGR